MIKSERARMHRINVVFAHIAKTFIILYAIFLTAVWLSERDVFQINAVDVKGTHTTSPTDIGRTASLPLSEKFLLRIARDNVLLYPEAEVIQKIHQTYPRVMRTDISFPTRHRLTVQVEEYTPAFLYCLSHEVLLPSLRDSSAVTMSSDVASSTEEALVVPFNPDSTPSAPVLSDCYFADKDAYVFARAPEYSGYPYLAIISPASTTLTSEPLTPIGGRILGPVDHARINSFIFALSKLSLSTHVVTLRNSHDVEFHTSMPWTILWTTSEDPVESAKNLEVVLQSLPSEKTLDGGGLKRIDLRFGNKVFYKME